MLIALGLMFVLLDIVVVLMFAIGSHILNAEYDTPEDREAEDEHPLSS